MKAVLAIALVAVAIAAPYVIPGILGVAAGSLAAIAVTAAVEVGIALVSSAILGPSVPKSAALTNTATSRLYATLVTTEPRKIWFGNTAGGTDVRYQTYTGSKQEFYQQIIAHASHQVDSIDEVWIDNEKAWTKAGGVQGRYAGWLTDTARENATSLNGIAIDGVWTSTCTLTGCAYSYLQFKLLDPSSSSNTSPFQSGVSGRLTFRGKGALTYDPRLDSTVTGGSGSMRAGTQSTWAWDDNASRNPAIQLLWFLLGWQINGKLAVGMGLPSARIDLPSFITAANHCDESVALAAGGTEPRYRSDGLISEGDERSTVVENLCTSMNATLRDNGGKISVQVLNNDLATPVASFTLNDILGSEEYDQTQALNDYFNIVRGRHVDPSDNALYQLSDFPQVVLTSPDGIDRVQTVDFPLVQSVSQVQRLAKLRLKRAQYQAHYSATFGPKAWAASLGNIVELTHAGMNWTSKLFRVVAQSIAQNGQVKMTLLEESTDVYSWAAEDVAGIVAGTPTVVDPTLTPILQGITGAAADITGPAALTINADYTGAVTTAMPFEQQFSLIANGTDVTTSAAWSVAQNSGTMTATIGAATGILSIDESSGDLESGSVTLTAVYNGSSKDFVVKVSKVNADAPSSGSAGGTSATGTTNNASFTATTMTAVGTELDITLGSSGQAVLSADYTFTADANRSMFAQWFRWNGSSWVALGSPIQSATYIRFGDPVEGTPSFTATGLTANSAQRFQIFMHLSGTATASITGTNSAVGS